MNIKKEELYECAAYFHGNAHYNCKKEVPENTHIKYRGHCSKECQSNTEKDPDFVMSFIKPASDKRSLDEIAKDIFGDDCEIVEGDEDE